MKKFQTIFPLIVNGLACAAIGAAFGSYLGIFPGLIGGFIIGVLVAAIWEALFQRLALRPRIFHFRPVFLVLLEFFLTLLLVIPLVMGWYNTHPKRLPIPITPAEMDLPYEDVQLTTSDGIPLAGWYIPSRNGAAIIALHGFNGNRAHVLPHAKILHQAGYGVLLFDLRAQGESGGKVYHFGWAGDLDVAPAIAFLQTRPEVNAKRIGIIGLSSGGMTTLNAAAKLPSLRAVIVDGVEANRMEDLFNPMPPSYKKYWFMAPMPWMTDRATMLFSSMYHPQSMQSLLEAISPRPVLFIASGAESEIFQARKFVTANPQHVSLWEIPEAKHIEGIFILPEEYADRLLSFYEDNLR